MASSISRMRASLIKTISSTTNHHWFRLPLTSSTRRATTRRQTISTLSLPASSLINTKRSPLFSRLTQPHLTQMLLTSNPNLSTLRGSETTNDWTKSFRFQVNFKLVKFIKRDQVNYLLILLKMVENSANNELPKQDIGSRACATPDCIKQATM